MGLGLVLWMAQFGWLSFLGVGLGLYLVLVLSYTLSLIPMVVSGPHPLTRKDTPVGSPMWCSSSLDFGSQGFHLGPPWPLPATGGAHGLDAVALWDSGTMASEVSESL